MSQHSFLSTRISASAGSGKTYQLASRYIGLLALGVEPEKIIALTFTKKAAAEFSSRILVRLSKAASSDRDAEQLTRDLILVFKGSESQPGLITSAEDFHFNPDRSFYLHLLKKLLNALGKLNMSTLDSFFSKLLGVLQLDLGMVDFSIASEDDLEVAKEDVFHSIYSSDGLPDQEKEDFLNVFKQATFGKESDSLDWNLRSFVSDYHSHYLDAWDRNLWANEENIWMDQPWWLDAPDRDQAERIVSAMTEDVLRECLVRDDGKPAEGGMKPMLAFPDKLLQRGKISWPSFVKDDFLEGLKSGSAPFKYYQQYTLSGEWADNLYLLFKYYVKNEIQSALRRTRGIYDLINLYETIYNARIRQHGRLTFSDAARVLLPDGHGESGLSAGDEALMDLQYRLDGWFDHWMLDEFQDTSKVQWGIIKPFLEELIQDVDGLRSLFIVGDTKQSIYQWRGGSPRIFESVMDQGTIWGQVLKPWSMDVSYRSSRAVLDLVNTVCRFRETADMSLPAARERWKFEPHYPEGDAATLDGCAEVRMVGNSSSDSQDDAVGTPEQRELTKLLQHIQPLERGLTCAVLVGTNAQASVFKDWLCSEEGGGVNVFVETDVQVGLDSAVGKILFDFFVWLSTPGDCFAWAHLLASPLGGWFAGSDPDGLWVYWKGTFEKGGYVALLDAWEARMEQDAPELLNGFQRKRLSFWRQAAFDADEQRMPLEEWLETIKKIKKKEHSRSDAVQIMTFHKAKGLEFDVVLLPMCKISRFDDGTHYKLMKQEDNWGNVTNVVLSPGSDLVAKDPVLKSIREDWAAESQLEGFCTLYVALTRARQACYVIIKDGAKQNSKSDVPCNPSAIIKRACELEGKECSPGEEALVCYGNPSWYEKIQHNAGMVEPQIEEKITLPAASPLGRISPSSLFHGKDFSGSVNHDAIRLGNEVHALFQQISWLDEQENVAEEGVSGEAVALFDKAMESDDVVKWFKKPQGKDVRLWREKPLSGLINGQLIQGQVDRVHLVDGVLTIIDFKTDALEDIGFFRDKYADQLECYRTLLCEALDISQERSTCVIIGVRIGKSVEF